LFGESEWNRRRDDGRIEKLSNNNTLKESAENWSDRNGSIIRFLCEGGKKGRLKSITSWACKLYFFELCTLGYSAGLICYSNAGSHYSDPGALKPGSSGLPQI